MLHLRRIPLARLLDWFRANLSRTMATSTVGAEIRKAFAIHDGLGHDGPCRITGTQKKHVVAGFHSHLLVKTGSPWQVTAITTPDSIYIIISVYV